MTEIKSHSISGWLLRLIDSLCKPVSAAPLIVFRMAFGVMMFLSLLRFVLNGWVDALYIQPKFFFTFYGFDFVKPLGATGMYVVFGVMMVAALLLAFGWFYRMSVVAFFLLFTYVELIDKSNYLNHYYFISLISFLMCLLPMPSGLAWHNKGTVPKWAVLAIQMQMATVYFFAGIAKINPDWLLAALPLKIWLASKSHIPFIGGLLTHDWIAYAFSWCGMLFDVLVAFFLFNRKTVWYTYAVVVFFHVLTALLFPMIGMFPFIMIVCATVFLPVTFHEKLLGYLRIRNVAKQSSNNPPFVTWAVFVLFLHFTIQLLLPFRYLMYPSGLFWHEQGFRFSWRVMLMEKAGTVFYTLRNSNGKLVEVNNRQFLTMQQEKQMSTQPDMILQFAHYLSKVYGANEVYAEAYVALNGRASKLLINPTQNLCLVKDDFCNKTWVTSFK